MATTRFKHDDAPSGLTRCATTPDRCTDEVSSVAEEPAISIDSAGMAELIAFFRLLDNWDQEERNDAEIV